MDEETCPVHDALLERVTDNKFRCPEGHDVHESAVGRGELFEDLQEGDDPALAAFADALVNYEGGSSR